MKNVSNRLPGNHALPVAAWLACLVQIITVPVVHASSNLPLHHWGYDAIERLTAMDIIDRAMLIQKPYSRMQAAKYVARAIEQIRTDKIAIDGREIVAEPLLERLTQEFRPELIRLGVVRATAKIKPDRCGSERV